MNWIKKIYTPLLTVMISCFVGIVAVELTLRVVHSSDPWAKTKEANILRDIQFSYDISALYEDEATVVDYVRNQYGLRDGCESTSEIDILTIGGSTTDQRYVSFISSYQSVMEEYLKNVDDNFGCVSNAGVDGHSTWGHLFSFEHWFPLIPALNPEIILLYVGINDSNFLRSGPKPGFDSLGGGGVKSFLKSFEIVRALMPIYRLFLQSSDNTLPAYAGHDIRKYTDEDYTIAVMNEQTALLSEQNASAFYSRMETLLDNVRSLGATPLCVTQPHKFIKEKEGVIFGVENVIADGFSGIDYDYSIKKLNEVIFDLCGKNTVDLYSHEFSIAHFYDGVHTTASGSREIGRVIAEFIIENFY